MRLVYIFLLIFAFRAFGHGHHHDSGVDELNLIETVESEVQKAMVNAPLNPHKNPIYPSSFITFTWGKNLYSMSESSLSIILKKSIDDYQDVIRKGCECEIPEVEEHFEKNFDNMLGNFKRRLNKYVVTPAKYVAKFPYQIASSIFWSTVPGVRRYGLTFGIVMATAETIEHVLLASPIPFCKALGALSLGVSARLKTILTYAHGITDISDNMRQRFDLIRSRLQYRREFQKKVMTMIKDQRPGLHGNTKYKKVKSWFNSWNTVNQIADHIPPAVEEEQVMSVLDELEYVISDTNNRVIFYDKSWLIDRRIMAMNFMLDLAMDQFEEMKEHKEMTRYQYLKASWSLNAFGSYLDHLGYMLQINNHKGFYGETEAHEKVRIRNLDARFFTVLHQVNKFIKDMHDHKIIDIDAEIRKLNRESYKQKRFFAKFKAKTKARFKSMRPTPFMVSTEQNLELLTTRLESLKIGNHHYMDAYYVDTNGDAGRENLKHFKESIEIIESELVLLRNQKQVSRSQINKTLQKLYLIKDDLKLLDHKITGFEYDLFAHRFNGNDQASITELESVMRNNLVEMKEFIVNVNSHKDNNIDQRISQMDHAIKAMGKDRAQNCVRKLLGLVTNIVR